MSSTHGDIYNILLAHLYWYYGFPNYVANDSGGGIDLDGTAAVLHGNVVGGGKARHYWMG